MNKHFLLFTFTFLLLNNAFGQNYSPLLKGDKKYFSTNKFSYTVEVLNETVLYDGQEYYKSITKYSWGKEDTILLSIHFVASSGLVESRSSWSVSKSASIAAKCLFHRCECAGIPSRCASPRSRRRM